MNEHDVAEELATPIAQHLLTEAAIPARFAYTGVDGDPRVVPVGFFWNGTELEIYTVPASAKVGALRRNPRVAITIDTEHAWPPRVLLIRGAATVDVVDGVPDNYVRGSDRFVPAAEMPAWEAGVRALYRQMARIVVRPDWAKLLDFETTIPKAVADLVAAQQR